MKISWIYSSMIILFRKDWTAGKTEREGRSSQMDVLGASPEKKLQPCLSVRQMTSTLKIWQRMRKSTTEISSIEIKQEGGEQEYYLKRNVPYNSPLALSKSNIFRAPSLSPQLRNWKKEKKKKGFHIFLMLSCLRTF